MTPDPNGGPWTVDKVTAAIRAAQAQSRGELGTVQVASSGDKSFVVMTNRVNPPLIQAVLGKAFPNAQISAPQVDEVVGDAIMQAFAGQLQIQENLQPTIASTEKITEQVLDSYPELAEYVGGVKMNVTLARPATLKEIDQRMKDLRFRPDTQDLAWYPYQIFGADLKPVAADQAVTTFTFASTEPEAGLRELTDSEWTRFVDNEKTRVQSAVERETSLSRVTQIDPFVGSEARTRSIISVVLSLAAIVGYIWLRFGTLRFGLAAIIACFHDVSTALGAVAASTFLATTFIGQALLIGDFRINSTVIAAILTLLGYSLNDTIVVFDRIRENRRKLQLTARSITDSINQTLSRTVITGITTFMVVAVMYIFGGSGLQRLQLRDLPRPSGRYVLVDRHRRPAAAGRSAEPAGEGQVGREDRRRSPAPGQDGTCSVRSTRSVGRDYRIGLVAGSILAGVALLWVATRPSLSPLLPPAPSAQDNNPAPSEVGPPGALPDTGYSVRGR